MAQQSSWLPSVLGGTAFGPPLAGYNAPYRRGLLPALCTLCACHVGLIACPHPRQPCETAAVCCSQASAPAMRTAGVSSGLQAQCSAVTRVHLCRKRCWTALVCMLYACCALSSAASFPFTLCPLFFSHCCRIPVMSQIYHFRQFSVSDSMVSGTSTLSTTSSRTVVAVV